MALASSKITAADIANRRKALFAKLLPGVLSVEAMRESLRGHEQNVVALETAIVADERVVAAAQREYDEAVRIGRHVDSATLSTHVSRLEGRRRDLAKVKDRIADINAAIEQQSAFEAGVLKEIGAIRDDILQKYRLLAEVRPFMHELSLLVQSSLTQRALRDFGHQTRDLLLGQLLASDTGYPTALDRGLAMLEED